MQAYQNGNFLAFEILYDRHRSRVFGFLMTKLKNRFEAEEVFQSTFMKLHSSRKQYDSKFKFVPWLFTLCSNSLKDFLRSKKRKSIENNTGDDVFLLVDESKNKHEDLNVSLEGLDEKQRLAIEMRYQQGMDFDEIAKTLRTSNSNIRQIISRAVKMLKKHISKEGL